MSSLDVVLSGIPTLAPRPASPGNLVGYDVAGSEDRVHLVVDEPFFDRAPALFVSLFCFAQNPEMLDLILVPHDLTINVGPLGVGLPNAVLSSQLVRCVQQAELKNSWPRKGEFGQLFLKALPA